MDALAQAERAVGRAIILKLDAIRLKFDPATIKICNQALIDSVQQFQSVRAVTLQEIEQELVTHSFGS
jgi:hypothetical protein